MCGSAVAFPNSQVYRKALLGSKNPHRKRRAAAVGLGRYRHSEIVFECSLIAAV